MVMFDLITTSVEETKAFGAMIANIVDDGACILLSGDLGAGKTVIASGIVAGKTLEDYEVTSPTFNIVQQYESIEGKVYHFDLYRIESVSELENIGAYEYLFDKDAISVIEWPERAPELEKMLKIVYKLTIEKVDETSRRCKIEKIKG